ncbi:UDP-glycosyltransferase UGT5-like [Daphnia carinata]|uniref:UDP-glycosyltransferase UGT5-like n=1 Tax=Daphnia carinata TaxID=120202 RepID=UPI00257A74F4|nr:UDP-glycosyltransferase UGT5-like [Daphnia carinata]
MRFQLIALVVLSALAMESCMGERIVVLYPMGSKSHFYAVLPLLEELAERGHNVTVFSAFKGITKTIKNANEIILPSIAQKLDAMEIDWFAMQKQGPTQILTMMSIMTDFAISACEEMVTNPEFRNVIKNRDVDLFIADAFGNEFTYPIIDKMGIPFVIHGSSSLLPITLDAMGAPKEYAAAPTMTLDFDNHMNFFQRLLNVVSGESLKFMRDYFIIAKLDAIVQREFPGVKTIQEVEGDASLYISNAHAVTNWPRSLPPTVLTIGAIHARPAKQLPPKFKAFADEAKDGFIVLTLGSFVSVSSMPQELVDTFMRVFSKLPQRVIWKWEATIPANIPPNVMMVDWLPQQDLLGHPNARLFITHGGMLGTQETIYHGVPMLGLPFGNDQRANVARAVRDGWGLKLDWDKLDDRVLDEALRHLINDPSVRANATKWSQLMRDEIMPGKDVAAYWIEYVIRHGSTKHLQMASKNMPSYQRHLIDVALFLGAIASLFLLFVFMVIRTLLRCCRKPKSAKLKTK